LKTFPTHFDLPLQPREVVGRKLPEFDWQIHYQLFDQIGD
jgi:hypothetical protein